VSGPPETPGGPSRAGTAVAPELPATFACTVGGTLARSRRRLRRLLQALAAILLAAGAIAAATDRAGAGVVAAVAAFLPILALGMSGDLDVQELELAPGELVVRMRRRVQRLALVEPRGRSLTDDERRHLEGLVSAGGFTAGTGGVDSHRLGEVEIHASDFDHALLVETGEERLVLTPDEPERFLATLRLAAAATSSPAPAP
jgi:hypothetical protein